MRTPPKPGDEVIWKHTHRCYVQWVDGNTIYVIEVDEFGNQAATSDEQAAKAEELELV